MRSMDLAACLLDSWDRQNRIVLAVASRVNDSNKDRKPSDDGMTLCEQLEHIHEVRRYWLSQIEPDAANALPSVLGNDSINSLDRLSLIHDAISQSGIAIRSVMEQALESDLVKTGFYDNPVLFLQHMIWHEGWHVGLMFLALRLAGEEPTDEWEQEKVWSEWRTEEY